MKVENQNAGNVASKRIAKDQRLVKLSVVCAAFVPKKVTFQNLLIAKKGDK